MVMIVSRTAYVRSWLVGRGSRRGSLRRGGRSRGIGLELVRRDLALQLWEFLEEDLLHAPTAHITVILLEQRTEVVGFVYGVVSVCLIEGEWPAESEVQAVLDGEVTGAEVIGMVPDETISESRPGND